MRLAYTERIVFWDSTDILTRNFITALYVNILTRNFITPLYVNARGMNF